MRPAPKSFRLRWPAGADAPRLLTGPEGLKALAAMDGPDVVLNSVVGIAGLGASLAAIESGHDLALANKESLVTGGHLRHPGGGEARRQAAARGQ